jgi:hypothetical protein
MEWHQSHNDLLISQEWTSLWFQFWKYTCHVLSKGDFHSDSRLYSNNTAGHIHSVGISQDYLSQSNICWRDYVTVLMRIASLKKRLRNKKLLEGCRTIVRLFLIGNLAYQVSCSKNFIRINQFNSHKDFLIWYSRLNNGYPKIPLINISPDP